MEILKSKIRKRYTGKQDTELEGASEKAGRDSEIKSIFN